MVSTPIARAPGRAVAEQALEAARRYPDPTLLLRAAAGLLTMSRDARALADLVEAASRVERALPDERTRAAFRRGAPLADAG